MTKKKNSIILKSVETTDLKETQLSIQINLDGFSFCIHNSDTPIVFERYEFHSKAASPEEHLNFFTSVFEENEFLTQSYSRITVVHQNELGTLVPSEYFNEDNLTDYLKNTVKVLPIDYISNDEITNFNAHTVYIPFVNINNYLFSKFGSFEYFHSFTILHSLLSQELKAQENHSVFINVNTNDFELLAYKNNELQLINSYKFSTAEDFIYFILFSMEQLAFDTDKVAFILLGDIEKESELYEILYKYVRNIKFYTNTRLNTLEEKSIASKHSNFIVYNQYRIQ